MVRLDEPQIARGSGVETEGRVADTERGSFSGHESFSLRYGWPKKCVDAVSADPDVFSRDEAMVVLGVGKNMVKAIRHWGLATGVVEAAAEGGSARMRALRVTAFGAQLFRDDGVDPYLEDPRTLWLLHWQICTRRDRATTWAWAFGSQARQSFSRDELRHDLAAAGMSSRATASSLARDVEVFVRTYVPAGGARAGALEDNLDCPLIELRLLRELPGERRYEFVRGPKPSLDDVALGYALLDFWGRVAPERDTLGLADLARHPASPGRIFKLDETSLAERLADVARWTRGAVLHDDTAGVQQLMRRKRIDPMTWLRSATRGRAPG